MKRRADKRLPVAFDIIDIIHFANRAPSFAVQAQGGCELADSPDEQFVECISVRLTQFEKEAIEQLAAKSGKSKSAVIRMLLRNALR